MKIETKLIYPKILYVLSTIILIAFGFAFYAKKEVLSLACFFISLVLSIGIGICIILFRKKMHPAHLLFLLIGLVCTVSILFLPVDNPALEKLDLTGKKHKTIYTYDSHGGFLGDGMSLSVYQFRDDVYDTIKPKKGFEKTPLSANYLSLLESTVQSVIIEDEKFDSHLDAMKKTGDGLVLFYDRHSQADDPFSMEEVSSRYSFNFSIIVYNREIHTLYVISFDT